MEVDLVPAVSELGCLQCEVVPAELQRQGGLAFTDHHDSHGWGHALVALEVRLAGGRLTRVEAGGGKGGSPDPFAIGAHILLRPGDRLGLIFAVKVPASVLILLRAHPFDD